MFLYELQEELVKTIKTAGKVLLVLASAWVGLNILLAGYLSLRYSPTYMYREIFTDMPTAYDYLIFPERKLTASPDPFLFAADPSKESLVRETFQVNPKIGELDSFLADTGTQAFLVIQNDTIIYERYFGETRRDSLVTSFSIAKSFDSALIGIAIEEGYIKSAEEPITDYIPELAERDPRFIDIQIRHLLMQSSGLRYDDKKPFSMGDGSLTYSFDDLRHLALNETEVIEPAGVNFVYNNYNPLLLGMILERATGRPVTTYLQEKIWTPIGMEFGGSWSLDSEEAGFEKMESGLNARAVDFVKLGRLYLNGGNWDGKQIVPSEWVAASTQDNGLLQELPLYYGYMWWGKRCDPASHDFFALGNLGQFVYVSSAKNLILVRNGERYGLQGEVEEWAEIFCQFSRSMP
jgi:CubicO group peptidase (beta-lactamase class C family)